MHSRIGNITIHIDADELAVRPQAESSDSDRSDCDTCCVFVEGGSAYRLQLSGTHDALRAFAEGIVAANDTIEQRKLAAALPPGASF